MSRAKPASSKGTAEVLRHAVGLVKRGENRALADYAALVYPQHANSLELAKLWYFACRELEANYEAAGVAVRMIAEGSTSAKRVILDPRPSRPSD